MVICFDPGWCLVRLLLLRACASNTVGSSVAETSGRSLSEQVPIVSLQWNPHWECFQPHLTDTCGKAAITQLESFLSTQAPDFMSLIMMETDYTVPAPYAAIKNPWVGSTDPQKGLCGNGDATLLYNAEKFTVVESKFDCTVPGRAMVAASLTRRPGVDKFTVIAAHMPHPGAAYEPALQKLQSAVDALGNDRVIVISDTNQEPAATYASPDKFMCAVAPANCSTVTHTEDHLTCCNTPSTFVHKYDRIIANFGADMKTVFLMDPLPAWAKVAENLHKPILGTFYVVGPDTVGTDTLVPTPAPTPGPTGEAPTEGSSSGFAWYWWLLIGLGALLVVLGIVCLVCSSKRKKSKSKKDKKERAPLVAAATTHFELPVTDGQLPARPPAGSLLMFQHPVSPPSARPPAGSVLMFQHPASLPRQMIQSGGGQVVQMQQYAGAPVMQVPQQMQSVAAYGLPTSGPMAGSPSQAYSVAQPGRM